MDILLDSSGDIALNRADIVLSDSVCQKISIRLRWFLNEWKFNKNAGVPYYEEIFVKQYDIENVKQLLEEEILSVDEVDEISSLEASVDIENRALSVSCSVVLTDGEEVKVEVNV